MKDNQQWPSIYKLQFPLQKLLLGPGLLKLVPQEIEKLTVKYNTVGAKFLAYGTAAVEL